jgi:hypothetical protein
MKWLAKINFSVVVQKIGAFKSALYLLTLISLCLFIGYRIGNYYHHAQVSMLAQQKQRLNNSYLQQEQYIERINTLEVELTLEQLANKEAQHLLKKDAAEHYEVKKELAFYEKIMAPEKQAGSLVVDTVKFFKTTLTNQYHFQITLLQQLLKRSYSKGDINLTFLGVLDNKQVKLKLPDISSINKKDRSFSFQFFQVISGDFILPENFIPESIELTVNVPKRNGQKAISLEKKIPWKLDSL